MPLTTNGGTMYVSVDLNKLVVRHKHSSFITVCNLVDIECRNCDVAIFPVGSSKALEGLPLQSLTTLYNRITNEPLGQMLPSKARLLITEAIERLPLTDAVPAEVEKQAAWLASSELEGWFWYVKGASRPRAGEELSLLEYLETEGCAEARAKVLAGQYKPKPSAEVNAYDKATAAKAERATGVKCTTAPADPNAVPRSQIKATIWEVADKMWEEAGRPTELAVVLKLRKGIMDALEPMGIKRTTASVSLGKWQIEKL